MLSKLFCFGGAGGDADWASRAHYGHLGGATARARVLEVVEEEVEERYAALSQPAPARASQDASYLRRLYNANLPSNELSMGKELLRKLAAIDHARLTAEAAQQQLTNQFKAAEAAHRQAEFARARAEAIATARGEALMHAQQATRDAEMQQLQLAEMLKAALPQLGIDISPLLQANAQSPLLIEPAEETVTPLPRQSIFSQQQLAAVAASISKLPHQSQAGGLPKRQQPRKHASGAGQVRGSKDTALHAEQQQQLEQKADAHMLRPSEQQPVRRSKRESAEGSHGWEAMRYEGAAAKQQAGDEDQLSGFTVYTNDLQSPEYAEGDDGEVAQPRREASAAGPAAAPAVATRNSQGSGVAWRSISSAAVSSRSVRSADEEDGAELDGHEQMQPVLRQSNGSRGSSDQRNRQSRGSKGSMQEAAAPADRHAQPGGNRLQQLAQQLPKLVLPGVDASQLDSLVRIGASMQSPDPYAPPQQLALQYEQAGAAQWDSSANPLQSDADTERYLAELRAEARRQGMLPGGIPAGAGRSSRGGSSRTSLDGEAGAKPSDRRAQQQAAGQPRPLHELYAQGSKFPGAGTWVSPSLAAMIAHKKGHNPFVDGGEPSPPSHIKAVFGTTEDKEFYGPMAAHLNKIDQPEEGVQRAPPQQPASRLRPAGASAESICGPARQAPSNRSSMDGSADWDCRHQQHQQQAATLPAASRPAAPAGGRQAAPEQHRASAMSVEPREGAPHKQAPPERRQSAFLNRFQPMGMYAQQAAAPAPSQQQQQQQAGPRHSSVALEQLGAGGEGRRQQQRSADENLAATAMQRASLRGSGLPPRHHQPAAAAPAAAATQAPATKRSLDSMRGSIGGSAAANNIHTSIHAVEAAMAAMRDANPHLRDSASQQQRRRQAVPSSDCSGPSQAVAAAPPPGGARHARTRSLPDSSSLDLPLAALGTSVEQQRREQLLGQQARAGATYGRHKGSQ